MTNVWNVADGITFNPDGVWHHTVHCRGCSAILLETTGPIHLPQLDVRVAFRCAECLEETVWTDLRNRVGPSFNRMVPIGNPRPEGVA